MRPSNFGQRLCTCGQAHMSESAQTIIMIIIAQNATANSDQSYNSGRFGSTTNMDHGSGVTELLQNDDS